VEVRLLLGDLREVEVVHHPVAVVIEDAKIVRFVQVLDDHLVPVPVRVPQLVAVQLERDELLDALRGQLGQQRLVGNVAVGVQHHDRSRTGENQMMLHGIPPIPLFSRASNQNMGMGKEGGKAGIR